MRSLLQDHDHSVRRDAVTSLGPDFDKNRAGKNVELPFFQGRNMACSDPCAHGQFGDLHTGIAPVATQPFAELLLDSVGLIR